MRTYTTSGTTTAAKIIAIQRDSLSSTASYLIIYDAPEVGTGSSGYATVTAQWVSDNSPVVGGYFIDRSGTKSFMLATAFESIFTLATT